MKPGKYNFICSQGATFSTQMTWEIDGNPVDLTTYSARMQIREKYTSPQITINLTTENGRISLGGINGTINLLINSSDTESIVAKEYVYDLELVSSSIVTRLIEGKFIVTPEVTR